MTVFAVVVLALGAGLAFAVSFKQFALGALLLTATGFLEAMHLGCPVGPSILATVGLFFCGQLGYVGGVAVSALTSVKRKPLKPEEPLAHPLDETRKSSAR